MLKHGWMEKCCPVLWEVQSEPPPQLTQSSYLSSFYGTPHSPMGRNRKSQFITWPYKKNFTEKPEVREMKSEINK